MKKFYTFLYLIIFFPYFINAESPIPDFDPNYINSFEYVMRCMKHLNEQQTTSRVLKRLCILQEMYDTLENNPNLTDPSMQKKYKSLLTKLEQDENSFHPSMLPPHNPRYPNTIESQTAHAVTFVNGDAQGRVSFYKQKKEKCISLMATWTSTQKGLEETQPSYWDRLHLPLSCQDRLEQLPLHLTKAAAIEGANHWLAKQTKGTPWSAWLSPGMKLTFITQFPIPQKATAVLMHLATACVHACPTDTPFIGKTAQEVAQAKEQLKHQRLEAEARKVVLIFGPCLPYITNPQPEALIPLLAGALANQDVQEKYGEKPPITSTQSLSLQTKAWNKGQYLESCRMEFYKERTNQLEHLFEALSYSSELPPQEFLAQLAYRLAHKKVSATLESANKKQEKKKYEKEFTEAALDLATCVRQACMPRSLKALAAFSPATCMRQASQWLSSSRSNPSAPILGLTLSRELPGVILKRITVHGSLTSPSGSLLESLTPSASITATVMSPSISALKDDLRVPLNISASLSESGPFASVGIDLADKGVSAIQAFVGVGLSGLRWGVNARVLGDL